MSVCRPGISVVSNTSTRSLFGVGADTVRIGHVQTVACPRNTAGAAENLPGRILIAFGEGQLSDDGSRCLPVLKRLLREHGANEQERQKYGSKRSRQIKPHIIKRRCAGVA